MTCSQSRAAISSRMAALTWVLRLSQTSTIGAPNLLVRGVEQGDVVGLGEAAPLALASTVDDHAVDEPAAPARPHTDQPGDRDPAGSLARDRDHRGAAASTPGAHLRLSGGIRPAGRRGKLMTIGGTMSSSSSSMGEAGSRHATLLAALRHTVLDAPAHTDPGLRSAAAHGDALPHPVGTYVGKVRDQSYRITETDLEALTAAGLSEDEIFEITVAAAVGAALRGLDAGMRALREGP
jgi:hypothetical protein